MFKRTTTNHYSNNSNNKQHQAIARFQSYPRITNRVSMAHPHEPEVTEHAVGSGMANGADCVYCGLLQQR